MATYTIMVLCFMKPVKPDNVQVGEEDYNNNARTRSICWSLGVVTVLWIVVGLIVAINIGVDGLSQFYGPTPGLCGFVCLSCIHV
jgi:hypothetical protein